MIEELLEEDEVVELLQNEGDLGLLFDTEDNKPFIKELATVTIQYIVYQSKVRSYFFLIIHCLFNNIRSTHLIFQIFYYPQ